MPFTHPIKFKNFSNGKAFPFSSPFVFAMVTKYRNLGGHDLAFTLSTSKELLGAFPRQYPGLLNRTVSGSFSSHIMHLNFVHTKINHVGVDINNMRSNISVPAEYFLDNSEKERFESH